MKIPGLAAALALLALPVFALPAFARTTAPVPIVAAENFYGDLAGQIGGNHVAVTSILTNPNQDPHLFEANADTARALAGAGLVIYNGADYDPWMTKLLSASPSSTRRIIVAARITGHKVGDNPHLWYDPRTMPAVAKAIAAALEADDPADKADFEANLSRFQDSLKPLLNEIASLHQRFAGTPVTATEPVFGYMAGAIGLAMRNPAFQIAIMNDTEPSPAQIAAFQNDLEQGKVRALFYNSQADEELTRRMRQIAQTSKVPVIGVSETEPPGTTYQAWMLDQIEAFDKALSGSTR